MNKDAFIADLFLQLAAGYADDDVIPLDGGLDYLIEAGQCRRIAAFLAASTPQHETGSK